MAAISSRGDELIQPYFIDKESAAVQVIPWRFYTQQPPW